MSEWTIVTVIAALVGLFAAIVSPIVKLNTTITRLRAEVDALEKRLDTLTGENTRHHEKLWDCINGQDKRLGTHETRIAVAEKSGRRSVPRMH